MNELLYTVWLSLACTPGSDTFAKLLSKFSSPRDVYSADSSEIAACIGSRSRDYNALIDKNTERAERIVDFCTTKHVGILNYFDRNFPDSLKRIKNPPVLLYYRGILPDFDREFSLAVVGSRKITTYGRKNTFTVSHDLARAGAMIVSGMATGTDGVALAAALSTGRPVVAVLGSGIDVCYPMHHRNLAREIVKVGCVMTEYAPGTKPERRNFPIRNRIISGLCRATLVIEGTERSGALITARHATEQGRPVYAFPGNVGNPYSEASNLLIKGGAKLFTAADDIVRDFELTSGGRLNPFKLAEKVRVDMTEVLTNFKISCVALDDNIFKVPYAKKQMPERKTGEACRNPSEDLPKRESDENENKVLTSFDKSLLDLYKKIPLNSDCSIESLVDGNHTLRDVIQGILKLEIAKFVTMLPGDRVKRNL